MQYFLVFPPPLYWTFKHFLGLPWCSSGSESTLQCRGYWFNPWSRKIPHAMGQLSPKSGNYWAPTPQLLKHVHLETKLQNKRSHSNEKPVPHNYRAAPSRHNQRKAHVQQRRPSVENKLNLKNFLMIQQCIFCCTLDFPKHMRSNKLLH